MLGINGKTKGCWRNMQLRKQNKWIRLNEDATVSLGKATKLCTSGVEGKGNEKAPASPAHNSESDGTYVTLLISS